jgi:hypothetical protein
VPAIGIGKKIKMAAIAMVTKVHTILNSLQTLQIFVVKFPVTSTSRGTRKTKQIGIGWTNFAAVAIEIKKRDFYFFHQTS